MPTTFDNALFDIETTNLYEKYLNQEINRDEYVRGHEELVLHYVGEFADDIDALRAIASNHVRTSRESRFVDDAIHACARRQGIPLCEHCHGVLFADGRRIEIESGSGETLLFCGSYCAAAEGWHISYGGEWLHESGPEVIHANDGTWFADENEASEAGYARCPSCGDWHNRSGYSTVVIDEDTSYCSGSCANSDGYEWCACCHEWSDCDHETVIVSEYGDTETWCEDCLDNTRGCCHCGVRISEDVAAYDDDDDVYYCPSCAQRYLTRGLHSYGYTPELKFRGDAKNSPYLGVELETDGGNDRASYVTALDNIEGFGKHFYMTKDSSLNNGVELTSHPCTLSYHANELYEMYEAIRSTALRYDFQSHNGGRCGLHVHMNRDFFGKGVDSQDVGGYKMMRLLQRFEPNFTKFSRRRDNGWCCYTTSQTYGPDKAGEPDDIRRVLDKANDMKYEDRHEQALNFQHDETFEFRIFRGTLNLSTFFASLGMVNGIAHVAKMHSAHYVETVEWSELMRDVVKACDEPKAREFLREYLEAKELL